MRLTDIKPKQSKLKLSLCEREFTLKPIDLNTEIWLEEEYGEEKINQIFQEVHIKELIRIVYRLLSEEDKDFLKSKEVTIMNEEGKEEKIVMGGIKLLRAFVSGFEDRKNILVALLENIGFSRGNFLDEENEEKKSQELPPIPNNLTTL